MEKPRGCADDQREGRAPVPSKDRSLPKAFPDRSNVSLRIAIKRELGRQNIAALGNISIR
jgi:hypothetical protein